MDGEVPIVYSNNPIPKECPWNHNAQMRPKLVPGMGLPGTEV